MKTILLGGVVALIIGSGLLFWGSSFALTMVHDQLGAQRITFPSRADLEKEGVTNQKILSYGGQQVDSGAKARAYSDYINGHLQKVAGGKTYSEVSAEYRKDMTNQTLAAQRQTLFMGETLRGLLLNAWGWGLIGTIAMYAAAGTFVAALVLLGIAVLAMPSKGKKAARR